MGNFRFANKKHRSSRGEASCEIKFSGSNEDRENIYVSCSAGHEQDWQSYPVDPYSAIYDDYTYIHTTRR